MKLLGHVLVPVPRGLHEDVSGATWWECRRCGEVFEGEPETECEAAKNTAPQGSHDQHQFGRVGAEQGAVCAASPPLSTTPLPGKA